MSHTLTIAALTVREALRRKLIAAFAVITLALVGLSAWGFDRLDNSRSITSGEVQVSLPQALILFMFMFSFVVALSASAMTSPAINAEVESGVLQAVATRPLRRSQIVFGKWLGLTAVLALYAGAVCALEFAVVDWVSGFLPPEPVVVALYLFAEGTVLLTLVLLLSTRLSAMATGVIGVAVFGAAWLAGVVGVIGTSFHISALRQVADVGRYVLPTDGLWHGAIYYLEPSSLIARDLADELGSHGNPFFSAVPPAWTYLLWVGLWVVVVLAGALVSFERREL